MSDVKYTVRNMTIEDVPQALDIWRETGNNVGTHCFYTWLKVDPEAFKVAVTNEGEVIGVCSACIHHDDLVFLGLYCVRKKYRGIGIGTKIWNACMEHVGNKNACLNSVPDKMQIYRDKAGFPIVVSDWVSMDWCSSDVHHELLSDKPPPGIDIEPLKESHFPLMYDYEEKLVNYNRQLALKLTCKEENSRTFVAVKDGICVGFGTIKMSCQGCGQVGPLYADSKEIAEVILKKLILSLPQAKGFVMKTLSDNDSANEVMKRIGCPSAEECPRLYRKRKVDVDHRKVYAQLELNFSPY